MALVTKGLRILEIELLAPVNNFHDVMNLFRPDELPFSCAIHAEPLISPHCLISNRTPLDEELIFLPELSPVRRAAVRFAEVEKSAQAKSAYPVLLCELLSFLVGEQLVLLD